MEKRESWTTRLAFILATLGFSAGIGNLWRFPYLVGKYGGGVFLLFYLLIVFLVSIPLFSIEITLGKATRKDPVGAYKALAPGTPWFINGYLNVFTIMLIAGDATTIVGSILAYVVKTATGVFRGMSSPEIVEYYRQFSTSGWEVTLWTAITIIIIMLILRRGLKKGIEVANNFMMPALFVVLVILIIRSLTLPGMSKGLEFYLKPDLSKFTWEGALAAIGQTFFAIGVAMAVALVYGSYLKKESKKVIANSGIIALASTLIAVMAGLIIFPSVFAFGLDPASGTGLTFITMPNVFQQMPAGIVFGTLFYLLFFLAALTSFIGAFEGIIAWIRGQFHLPRNTCVWIVGTGVLIVSAVSAYSSKFFLLVDYMANNVCLILGAFLMSIFVGWIWRIESFGKAAGIQSKGFLVLWSVLIKYVVPAVILITWLNQMKLVEKLIKLFQ